VCSQARWSGGTTTHPPNLAILSTKLCQAAALPIGQEGQALPRLQRLVGNLLCCTLLPLPPVISHHRHPLQHPSSRAATVGRCLSAAVTPPSCSHPTSSMQSQWSGCPAYMHSTAWCMAMHTAPPCLTPSHHWGAPRGYKGNMVYTAQCHSARVNQTWPKLGSSSNSSQVSGGQGGREGEGVACHPLRVVACQTVLPS
jgi:hypothetical protein